MVHKDQSSLLGKKVIITGAGSGIGRACAIAFAQAGASVLAVDMNEQSLKDLSAERGVKYLVADLASPEKFFPNDLDVDILINNACQTVRRPPAFYAHMMEGEQAPLASLPPNRLVPTSSACSE